MISNEQVVDIIVDTSSNRTYFVLLLKEKHFLLPRASDCCVIRLFLFLSVQRSSYALTPRAATLPVSGTFGGYVSRRKLLYYLVGIT